MAEFVIVRAGAEPRGLVLDGHELPCVTDILVDVQPDVPPVVTVKFALLREDVLRIEQGK